LSFSRENLSELNRHLVENFFAKLKQYQETATRYDKRATNFFGAIYLAATIVWLN
jgi:transposase